MLVFGTGNSGHDIAQDMSAVAASVTMVQKGPTVVVDCETGRMSLGLARDLALRLGADHVRLGEVAAGSLVDAVRAERAALDPALRQAQGTQGQARGTKDAA